MRAVRASPTIGGLVGGIAGLRAASAGLVTRVMVLCYRALPRGHLRTLASRYSTPNYSVGVMALVSRPDGHLLLVKETYRSQWALPGGFLEKGESARDAATREIREEAGLQISFDEPYRAELAVRLQFVTFFVAARVDGALAERAFPAAPEVTEVGWHDPDRLPPLAAPLLGGLTSVDFAALQALRERRL